MPVSEFLFIDGVKPNRQALRRIRSHAMQGKNAGRVLPARRRRQEDRKERKAPDHDTLRASLVLRREVRAGINWGPIDAEMCSAAIRVQFPFELSPAALGVVTKYFCFVAEKLYPPRLGLQPDVFCTSWLAMLVADKAALHCGLVLMEACNDYFGGDGKAPVSTEGLQHLSQALSLVNHRLAGDAALSDATFSLVVMLILHEQVRSKQAVAEIHFQGLAKMIELRGGMDKIEETSRSVVLKICKLDISAAWQSGRPLHFFRHGIAAAEQDLLSTGLGRYWSAAAPGDVSGAAVGLRPELTSILHDASHLAGFLNMALAAGCTIHIDTFVEMVVSICGRLVQFDSLGSQSPYNSSTTPIDAVYHIGLTIFSMTMMLQVDERRLMNYPLVSRRVRDVFRDESHDVEPLLRLWALMMSGIWLQSDNDEDGDGSSTRHSTMWLYVRIADTARELGIGDEWEQVYAAVRGFPWVDTVHNRFGRDVWNAASNAVKAIQSAEFLDT